MPDITKLIDLAALGEFKTKVLEYVDAADAPSLKYLSYNPSTRVASFYRNAEGTGDPAFTLTLPDTSNFIEKIANATAGDFVTVTATGDLVDAGATIAAEKITIADAGGLITATDVEGALQELASASAGGVASKTVYITETSGSSSDPFSKRYGIYQGATGSSASPVPAEKLADLDIPKDMVVESGTVGTVTTADVPYAGAVPGDKYIDLVIANATSDHIYIPANSLVDIYTAQQSATQVQLVIDNNNEISATIVAGSVTATELASDAVTTAKIADANVTTAKIADSNVTTAKIADENVTLGKLASGVQTSLGLADTAVQSVTASDPTTGTDGTITVDGTEVAVKGLGSAAYTASTAYDAAGTGASEAAAAVAALDSSTSDVTATTGSSLAVLTQVDVTDGLISGATTTTLGSAATHADTDFMASADYSVASNQDIDDLFS